ncbi:MAG TPA: pantetheine-phosphate adenylyltransferase [Candidatus Poseidoniia archaeon]|nr:pantetheine-phosphate adenylyltransferase [Candidatus Poseidoniia archaeon]
MEQVSRVCMGGTFDILHVGHEALLTRAANEGKRVLIGLTTDERASRGRNADNLNPYIIRKQNLENLLSNLGFLEKFEIVPLKNDWGPSVIDEDFGAIIVSEETRNTAEKINKIRIKGGKSELKIVVVPMIKSVDGKYISSSRIRDKVIDSEGNLT